MHVGGERGGGGVVCIEASGNILASGNISLSLFMAPLEITELLIFGHILDGHHIVQL